MVEKSHKHVSCESCAVRTNSLFAHFTPDEVSELNHHKSCQFYKKNQTIFVEGSFPRGVFCINHGKVKVYALGDEGKEQIVHIAKAGEVIGFRAMLSGEQYKLSASTLEDSNVCFVSKDDFLNMMDTNASLRNSLIQELSKELGERAIFITNLAQKTVRERLAYSLMILADIYGDEPINLSREDLANFVGTATETLIRLLKDMKEEGFIDTQTRKIFILKREELIQLAGGHR
ncbi:MAG: transcriptional regulator, Crp/Fnr family [Fluviicola sp.]|jgi:CRP/FNR family transcriptional regulator|uniref:Crp/Fnr family transcriptional regulator n=1 Tax=Fluviicola sp. TaxID=1917219 RepID=UPI0026358E6F|nr:Crp/Fnr family transcriptional regulator [Fluviicola sp.]MDF3026689.1 transcriptional regulator, Crp/Fnr family [Fluviicola sp.]